MGGAREGRAPTRVDDLGRERTPHPHVVLDADGHAFVRDTRVPVYRLWAWHRKGVDVERLVKRYPALGWAKVLDALSFAYDEQKLMADELAYEAALLRGEDAPIFRAGADGPGVSPAGPQTKIAP